MCTWPGNEANGLQCSGLFVARDRKLERRQRLKRVNPLPGGTMGATVSKIIQTITAILVCHCVSVCFFKQPISYRVVRVYYFASTPSLKILVSSKANVTLPLLQNLATRAFKDCLIASGWSNTGGGGGQAWDLPWDDHCCVKQPVGPLWGSVSLSHSVTPCDIMTSEDLCQCHTLWYCDKWGTFRRAGILLEGQGLTRKMSEREVWKGAFFLLGQFRNITNLLAHTRSAPSKAALALN